MRDLLKFLADTKCRREKAAEEGAPRPESGGRGTRLRRGEGEPLAGGGDAPRIVEAARGF